MAFALAGGRDPQSGSVTRCVHTLTAAETRLTRHIKPCLRGGSPAPCRQPTSQCHAAAVDWWTRRSPPSAYSGDGLVLYRVPLHMSTYHVHLNVSSTRLMSGCGQEVRGDGSRMRRCVGDVTRQRSSADWIKVGMYAGRERYAGCRYAGCRYALLVFPGTGAGHGCGRSQDMRRASEAGAGGTRESRSCRQTRTASVGLKTASRGWQTASRRHCLPSSSAMLSIRADARDAVRVESRLPSPRVCAVRVSRATTEQQCRGQSPERRR